MKKTFLIPGILCFAATTFAFPDDANARGCIKGAIVGGIAGHLVGHGKLGAAAGCAYGMHRRKVYDRENDRRSGYEQRDGNGERPGYSGD
jgi:outer membrane lipoprotein SlyB